MNRLICRDRRWCILILVAAFAASSVLARQPAPAPFEGEVRWQPLFQGIERAEVSAKMPRLMRGQAVRIDLKAPGVKFVTTPPMADKPNKTAGLKTSTFLTKHQCQVAINGASFSPVRNEEGMEQDVDGLQVSKGAVVSKGNGKYDALFLSKENKAWLASPPFDLKDVWNAVGGFQIVLKNGKVVDNPPDYNKGLVHPRTGVGISGDGRFLYFLVIDGRQEGFSVGATVKEVGAWLKSLGAAEGINMDGGGTSTLVIAGAAGKPKVLNQPINANQPGTERVAGSHLGVFALPLGKGTK